MDHKPTDPIETSEPPSQTQNDGLTPSAQARAGEIVANAQANRAAAPKREQPPGLKRWHEQRRAQKAARLAAEQAGPIPEPPATATGAYLPAVQAAKTAKTPTAITDPDEGARLKHALADAEAAIQPPTARLDAVRREAQADNAEHARLSAELHGILAMVDEIERASHTARLNFLRTRMAQLDRRNLELVGADDVLEKQIEAAHLAILKARSALESWKRATVMPALRQRMDAMSADLRRDIAEYAGLYSTISGTPPGLINIDRLVEKRLFSKGDAKKVVLAATAKLKAEMKI